MDGAGMLIDTWGVSSTKTRIHCFLTFSFTWTLYVFICRLAAVPRGCGGVQWQV